MTRKRVNPDVDNQWPKRCPGCQRTTYLRKRDGRESNKPIGIPAVQAALSDGTCHRCTRPGEAYRKLVGTDKLGRALPTYRSPHKKRKFTEEDAAAERQRVAKLILDRRARGIPKEGIDPEVWAVGNGGYYSFEIK